MAGAESGRIPPQIIREEFQEKPFSDQMEI
jgi:hypothetical protein